MRDFNIVFVSYGEANAEVNWASLKSKRPNAIRVDKVSGIINAYIKAAQSVSTAYFYLIDGDNQILGDFEFDFNPFTQSYKTYIFKARNAVNALEYGYGGIKLYKTESLLNYDKFNMSNEERLMSDFDFPIVAPIKFLPYVASVTKFNTSAYDAWKAAFRECCKLQTLGRFLNLSGAQVAMDQKRLAIWKTLFKDQPYGEWVQIGAIEGERYGKAHLDDLDMLKKINNYAWLKSRFENR
ncbi:hypothetical protein MUGA111182_11525 [Mucilaginibacter galii]|nr:hypothetical protein [Mucilaginibacter galii]